MSSEPPPTSGPGGRASSDDGDAAVASHRRWWRIVLVVILGGVASGLVGAVMSWLLVQVQWLAYGQETHSLLEEVLNADPIRRVLAPALGGLLAGLAWWWLRRDGNPADVEYALKHPGQMGIRRPFADALLQIFVVGTGASIGREGAPRQASGAVVDWLAHKARLSPIDSRALVASAAGAGLAAVYNVPFAGMVFGVELVLAWRPWQAVFAALPMSFIATVVAWPVVTSNPTYAFGPVQFHWTQLIWMLAAVPLTALLGGGFGWIANRASTRRPRPGWKLPVAMMIAGAAVGVASIWLPMLPGNGKDLIQVGFDGESTLTIYLALVILKPLATTLCLGSGMKGGLLTPALSVGAALGIVVALIVPGQNVSVFALLGAAGVLAVTQRAPIFGAVMAWELTHAPLWALPMLLVVSCGAWAMAEGIDRRDTSQMPPSAITARQRHWWFIRRRR